MQGYAAGTAEAGAGYELYGIDDHVNDAAAIAAFEADMKEQRPDLRLAKADSDNLKVFDSSPASPAIFRWMPTRSVMTDIVELIETYDLSAVDADAA